jgi:hypothetical protein
MDNNHAYCAAFFLLEKYLHIYGLGGEPRSFDLESFLTFMTPVNDRKSLDPAYWIDWLEMLDEEGIAGDIDRENLLKATRAFTQKYINEFGFDLGGVPEKLRNVTVDDPDLDEAIKKAQARIKEWEAEQG